MIIPYKDIHPQIADNVFVAPDAHVIGDVTIESKSSVFFGAVLRGDIMPIIIGEKTNIQEHCIFHTTRRRVPLVLGNEVTVGHGAILHGCKINNRCLIGMGSIILDEAEIGEESVVGAGALITEGKKFPKRSLIIGSPAKVAREVTEQEVKFLIESSKSYIEKASYYREYFKTK